MAGTRVLSHDCDDRFKCHHPAHQGHYWKERDIPETRASLWPKDQKPFNKLTRRPVNTGKQLLQCGETATQQSVLEPQLRLALLWE
jgi:hypothetical protein